MKRLLIIIGIVIVALAVAFILAVHSSYAKRKIASYLIQYFHNEYGLQIQAGPLNYQTEFSSVKAHVDDVRIYGGRANTNLFFRARGMDIDMPYSSLWRKDFIIRRLALDSPVVDPDYFPHLKQQQTASNGTFQIQKIELTGGALQYQQIALQDLELAAQLKPDSLVLQKLNGRMDTIQFAISGQLDNFDRPNISLNYTANGDFASLKKTLPQVPPLSGTFELQGKAAGALKSVVAEGTLQSSSVSAYGEKGFPLTAKYKYDSGSDASPFQLSAEWQHAPATIAQKISPRLPHVASSISGNVHYIGPRDFWQGDGTFQVNLDTLKAPGILAAGHIQGSLSNGTVHLSQSNLTIGSSRTSFSGTASQNSVDLIADSHIGNFASLAFISPELRKIPGSYDIHAKVQGPFKALQAQWDLNGRSPQMQVASTGSYWTAQRRIDASFKGQTDARIVNQFYPANMRGLLAFDGTARGTVSAPVFNVEIAGSDLNVQGNQIGEATARVQSDGKLLNASLELPSTTTTAQGSYNLSNHQFQLQAQATDFPISELRQVIPQDYRDLDGTVGLVLNASGDARRWKNARANLVIDHANATYRGLEVKLQNTRAELKNGVAQFQMSGAFRKGTLQASGNYDLVRRNFSITAGANQVDIAQFQPFFSSNTPAATGIISASLQASGNANRWKNADGHLILNLDKFQYGQYQANVQQATADLHAGVLSVNAAVETPQLNANVRGAIPVFRTGTMDVAVHGNADLSALALFTPDIQGNGAATLNVHVGGTLSNPDYSGQFTSQNFSIQYPAKKIALTNANATAKFSGAEVSLQANGSLNGAALSVNGTIPLQNNPGNVHLTLQNLSLASISQNTNVTGNVSIQMDASGTGRNLQTWSGKFQLTPTNLSVSGRPIQVAQPITVEMTTGRMVINQVHVTSGTTMDAQLQGNVDFGSGNVDARVLGSLDLMMVSQFLTNSAADGKLVTDLRISGKMQNPQIAGQIEIQNGMFRQFDSPVLLENIQLKAPINNNSIVIQNLNARMGGGTITGGGRVDLMNWTPSKINIQVKARSIGISYPDALRSQLNADLSLTNEAAEYVLDGNIQVIRSSYREDIDPRDRLVNSLLSAKTGLTTPPTSQSKIRLNLTLETLEDFQLRNNLGKVQASANLQVRGLISEPRISGSVRVRERSEIIFQGNRYEVQRGNIDFYGQRRFNPVFDIELYTITTDADSRQDYEITIPVSGPLHNLDRRDPTSYPPLAANQIYFLLLTGHADAQISTASSRFFQQQLAGYLSGQLFSDVQRKLANSLGLTRVEIQPEMISTETNPSAKLVLGKDFTNDLSLIYSVDLAGSQEQTWIANYKAPKNLSLRFVDQESGSYTANVRHLVRFGPGASTGALRNPRSFRTQKVDAVNIQNDSLLSDQEVSKEIGLSAGDDYDYWTVQDRVEKIQKLLQDRDVLFSRVELHEQQRSANHVNLTINIEGKQRRRMEFTGTQPSNSDLDRYRKLWIEGFSPEGVAELIREDLLRDLWLKGYHKAQVNKKTTPGDLIVHQFEVTPGALYSKGDIAIQNAEHYKTNELEEDLLKLYPGKPEMVRDAIHNFNALSRKITALYVKLGFLDATVEQGDLTLQGDQATKQIIVHEGPQYRIKEILVSDGDRLPNNLYKHLTLKEGSVYDPALESQDEVTIGDYYERLGYIKSDVEGEVKKTNEGLVLSYNLKKGEIAKVDDVEINGATFTKLDLIKKRVSLKQGEILNQEKIARAQRNLTDLRIFHQVTVHPEPTSVANHYRVIVDVMERHPYEVTYGFRYDTETSIGAELQLTDINFLGTGQSVSLYSRVHREDQLYSLTYHSPTLKGLKWATLLSVSYENGNFFLLQNEPFDGSRLDFTLQKQYNVSKNFQLIPGYQFELLNVTPLNSPDIQPVNNLKISRVIGTLLSDTRNDPFNAVRGSLFSIDGQFASSAMGSDVSYVKTFNQYMKFRQFPHFVWAQAYRVGLASDLPARIVTERFFAGGAYTIRGLQKDEAGPKAPDGTPLGGEALLIINQEIRFPVWKWFGGAAFYDAGNVYANVSSFHPWDLRHSVGIGLRVNSPFGIGRLDYGVILNRKNGEPRGVLHFALGQAF